MNIPTLFTGKYFTGRVKVLNIREDKNELDVHLTKPFSDMNPHGTYYDWHETWNLQHTIWGFENGDYIEPDESYFSDYPEIVEE